MDGKHLGVTGEGSERVVAKVRERQRDQEERPGKEL